MPASKVDATVVETLARDLQSAQFVAAAVKATHEKSSFAIPRKSLKRVRRSSPRASGRQVPAFRPLRDFADAGLLVTYGANLGDLYRRAASYVDRILKGARPGELAIEQPTKFDLVINLRTAKGLGITVPQSLLARAYEVLQ